MTGGVAPCVRCGHGADEHRLHAVAFLPRTIVGVLPVGV